jgi:16S rRNA processing protein RimM
MRLTVASVRGDEAFPILRFGEVGDRDAAEALRGYVLEIPSSALPELEADEFYPFDLIGLEVRDENGAVIGEVTDVLDSPAHALLLIAGNRDSACPEPDSRGSSGELVPFVTAAVPVVAVADGYLVLASGFRETLRSPDAPDPDRIELE